MHHRDGKTWQEDEDVCQRYVRQPSGVKPAVLAPMIQITPQMRILLAVDPVDFRKGIDGLAGSVKLLELDPFSGYLFVFRNRRGTSIKVITYDGQGFWCCQKRLSKGRFRWWPEGGTITRLAADELQSLLWNKDPGEGSSRRPVKKCRTR